MSYFRNEFKKPTILLVPLRLFIGAILLQAGFDKFFTPEWFVGTPLALFIQEQIQNKEIIFPIYQTLIESVVLPNVALFSGFILFVEIYCGIAILLGCFTNLALIVTIFLNLNLILTGNANPSTIYIVCQVILLSMNSGAVLGFDAALSTKIYAWFLVAQTRARRATLPFSRLTFITSAACFFLLALLSFSYIQNRGANPLEDAATSFALLNIMAGVMLIVFAFHSSEKTHQLPFISAPARLLEATTQQEPKRPNKNNFIQEDESLLPTSERAVRKHLQTDQVNITAQSINQLSTLLVPHQITDSDSHSADNVAKEEDTKQDRKAKNEKAKNRKAKDKSQDNNSNPLHKLYLE